MLPDQLPLHISPAAAVVWRNHVMERAAASRAVSRDVDGAARGDVLAQGSVPAAPVQGEHSNRKDAKARGAAAAPTAAAKSCTSGTGSR